MGKKKFSSSMEDHLEAIYWLAKEKGEVGATEISLFLGHKPPSVTEMLEKLSKKGLINHDKYGTVLLTPEGKRVAKEVSAKHKTLISFLELLGVDRRTAKIDACKIEHVVTWGTINRLGKLVEFVQKAPKKPGWLEHYRHFIKMGEHLECRPRNKTN